MRALVSFAAFCGAADLLRPAAGFAPLFALPDDVDRLVVADGDVDVFAFADVPTVDLAPVDEAAFVAGAFAMEPLDAFVFALCSVAACAFVAAFGFVAVLDFAAVPPFAPVPFEGADDFCAVDFPAVDFAGVASVAVAFGAWVDFVAVAFVADFAFAEPPSFDFDVDVAALLLAVAFDLPLDFVSLTPSSDFAA